MKRDEQQWHVLLTLIRKTNWQLDGSFLNHFDLDWIFLSSGKTKAHLKCFGKTLKLSDKFTIRVIIVANLRNQCNEARDETVQDLISM